MNIDKAIKILKNNGYTIPNGNTYNESEKYTIRDSEMLANRCLVAASKSVEYKTDYALLAVDFTEIYNEYSRFQNTNSDFDDFWADLTGGKISVNKVYKSMDIGEKALLEKRFNEAYRKYELLDDFK